MAKKAIKELDKSFGEDEIPPEIINRCTINEIPVYL